MHKVFVATNLRDVAKIDKYGLLLRRPYTKNI